MTSTKTETTKPKLNVRLLRRVKKHILAVPRRIQMATLLEKGRPNTRFFAGAGDPSKQKDGITLIAAERQRQLSVEGYTPEHDDAHVGGTLARAAAMYAIPYGLRASHDYFSLLWPWDRRWYKPTGASNRIRELVKSAALIAAEIDRLLRKESDRPGADSVSDATESADAVGVSSPKDSLSPEIVI